MRDAVRPEHDSINLWIFVRLRCALMLGLLAFIVATLRDLSAELLFHRDIHFVRGDVPGGGTRGEPQDGAMLAFVVHRRVRIEVHGRCSERATTAHKAESKSATNFLNFFSRASVAVRMTRKRSFKAPLLVMSQDIPRIVLPLRVDRCAHWGVASGWVREIA